MHGGLEKEKDGGANLHILHFIVQALARNLLPKQVFVKLGVKLHTFSGLQNLCLHRQQHALGLPSSHLCVGRALSGILGLKLRCA